MKIAVLIAAYNSEDTIGNAITGLLESGFKKEDIIVVDDGSSDRTGEIAKNLGVVVLRHPQNRGKGAGHKTGFDWIVKHDYDGVITIDADCQHNVREINRFLPVFRKDRIVYGDRTGNLRGMPFPNKFSNQTTSLVVSLLSRKRIKDSQCGFRLIGRSVIAKVHLKTNRFDTESELLIKASKSGFDITGVPVATLYPGVRSFIRPLKDTIRFVLLSARSLWS
jgi:glycosyltransferase involved in cell wall biosynthesis